MSLADSREWMDQADHDLAAARFLLGDPPGPGYADWVCFAAQQAGEKAVKAVRLVLGSRIEDLMTVQGKDRKSGPGHDLGLLFGPLLGLLTNPDPKIAEAFQLTDYEQQARYPGIRGQSGRAPCHAFSEAAALRAVENAERLVSFCHALHADVEKVWKDRSSP